MVPISHTDTHTHAPETSLNTLNPSEPNAIVYIDKGTHRRGQFPDKCVIIMPALNN